MLRKVLMGGGQESKEPSGGPVVREAGGLQGRAAAEGSGRRGPLGEEQGGVDRGAQLCRGESCSEAGPFRTALSFLVVACRDEGRREWPWV